MALMQQTPGARQPADAWWRLPEIWASLGITTIWLAVIFVSVYGGDMTFASTGNGTTVIPVGAVVAVCAAVATAAVSKRAFHR